MPGQQIQKEILYELVLPEPIINAVENLMQNNPPQDNAGQFLGADDNKNYYLCLNDDNYVVDIKIDDELDFRMYLQVRIGNNIELLKKI